MTAPIRQPRATRAVRFKPADVAHALKGALAAGMDVRGVTVQPDEIIRVEIGAADVPQLPSTPLDDWLEKGRARQT